ncbi:hypothetical protein D3C77_444660 [compost metagenome]
MREIVSGKLVAYNCGIGSRSLSNNDVANFDVVLNGPACPDPHQMFGPVVVNQFMDVDGCGRHPHAGALNRHAFAFIGSCEAQHTANLIVADGTLQKRLGNIFGAQRIARQ